MRGKVYTAVSMPDTVGITPAYAGKSPQSLFDAAQERDHPRLCGEKYGVTTDYLLGRGSPPPMRGKVMILKQKRVNERITPAYAGKRPLYSKLHQVFQDHPRLCGEKFPRTSILPHCKGSPPPMRGKASSTSNPRESARITPAYAGKRASAMSRIKSL